MGFRWPINLTLALLVTVGLAVGVAAGIQALLPLMMIEWIDPRWLRSASLLSMMLPGIILMVCAYRGRRAKKIRPKQD